MNATKILFVCSRNQWRSPTAEKVWSREPDVVVRSAGTSPKARRTISLKDMQWADMVFVMESKHRAQIQNSFGRNAGTIHVLNIPDDYEFMDPELVELVYDLVLPFLEER